MSEDQKNSQEKKVEISVVVPVFNEEGSVLKLHQEILETLEEMKKSFEIIFIDDGSSDKTYKQVKKLKPIKIIRFRKNFGQTAALDAGIKASRGRIIVTLDGDLQNDPKDIPKLIAKMEEGDFDVVSGWRKKRKDPFSKRFVSKVAEKLRKMLIDDGIHDSGCTLKAYKKECFAEIDLMGEIHRFIPATLIIYGFKVGEIEVNHRPRIFGVTKYNYRRTIKGFLDMLGVWFWRKYAGRPLHLFGGLGLLSFVLGNIFLFVLFFARLFFNYSLYNRIWPLLAVFLILVGIQLFISGLMADILIKGYYKGRHMNYSIKKEIENE